MTKDQFARAVADALEPTISRSMYMEATPEEIAQDVALLVMDALTAAYRFNPYDRNTAGVLAALRGPFYSMTPIEEIRALARKHGLSFTYNPGGGEFNSAAGRCQISAMDDAEDLATLRIWLVAKGREKPANDGELKAAVALFHAVGDTIRHVPPK